jgi:protein-tyrosine phosphatase
MTPADVVRLAELGIEAVYDLRSSLEFGEHPDPVPSINVPVLGRFMAQNERPDFGSMVEHDHGFVFMRDMTVNMLHWGAIEIGSVIAGLADADRLPAVFHCTAGKDRTGIVAAILLEVLGVDRDTVLDDFQLTDKYRGPRNESVAFRSMLSHGMPPEAAAGALGAPREMMGAVLAELDEHYGDAERYLVEHGQVASAAIDRLRTNLLG